MSSLQAATPTNSSKPFPTIPPVSTDTPQSILKRNTRLAGDVVIRGLTTAPNLSPSAPCFVVLPYWFSTFMEHVHEIARRGQMYDTTPLRLDYTNVLEAMISFANSIWTSQQWEAFGGCECQNHNTAELKTFLTHSPPTHIPFHDMVSSVFFILAAISSEITSSKKYDKPIKTGKKISKKLVKWPSSPSELMPHGPQMAISAFMTWARRIKYPAPLDVICRLAQQCPDLKSISTPNGELLPLFSSLFSHFITSSIQRFQPEQITEKHRESLCHNISHFMTILGFKSFWLNHLVRANSDETTASSLFSIYNDICTLLSLIDKYIPPSAGIQGNKEVFAMSAIIIHTWMRTRIPTPLHPLLAPYSRESTRIHHSAAMFVGKIAMLRSQQKCSQPSCAQTSKNSMKRCAACQAVRYCSKACQVDDWKEHKRVCKPLKAIVPHVLAYLQITTGNASSSESNPTAWFHSKAAEAGVTSGDFDCLRTYLQPRIYDNLPLFS